MRTSFALICLAALASSGQAAKTKAWHHAKASDHEKATLKGVVVSDDGTLSLSRSVRKLAQLDASHVWALAEHGGDLYAATGDEGKVFRIGKDGKASVAATCEGQALSLATDGKAVYAGTGPGGEIVKVGAGTLCKLPASYVWAIAAHPAGGLVAATGPEGKLFRIGADGKHSLLYDTKQDHVLCVAVAKDGTVYAGTDKTGRVYRIDPKGKASVVHQAAQSEARSLLLEGGVLHVGTSATKRRGAGTRGGSSPVTKLEGLKKAEAVPASTASAGSLKKDEKKEPEKGKAASAPSTPTAGENSIYRIAADGAVREVFRDKVMVMALARDGERLLAGTAMQGQLFDIGATEKTELARLDHGQLLCMLRRKDGTLAIGTGDPGAVYVLEDKRAASGTVTSEVLDAKLASKWGEVRTEAETPRGTSVGIEVRSGNVADPDDTWSEWGAKAPTARFLQYRATLHTAHESHTPHLKSITLRYAATNQAPEITRVEVPGSDNPRKLKLKWAATDANEDELRYSLFVKKDGWDAWAEIEDDLAKTDHEWDASAMPSGTYRLKVVASDRADNPEGEALTAERVSAPFVVCHDAPAVKLRTLGLKDGRMSLSASAESPLVRLASASFSVNGKKAESAFPDGGLFDGKAKTFSFRTGELKPGAYVVVLKVVDAAGNTGSADAVFTVPPRR
ncbi:MAG: hypothetical protein K2W96_27335 [Gemmataceae bacterium]|nr:hypothetical protein [Gemmataceae bacterium]